MMYFFLHILFSAFLSLPAQQEANPSASSLADAARAARERQKNSNPKHVLTDDDIAPGRGAVDSSATPSNESQARALMEKSYSKNPTVAELKSQADLISNYSKYSSADFLGKMKQSALYGYEKVDFPGRKEWEEQLETAVNHFLDEAAKAPSRLQTILDQNQDALARRDPETMQKVRAQWIDTLVPSASWQMRIQELVSDGQSRAKGYLTNSSAALTDYRRGRAKQAETTIGWTLIALRDEEADFKKMRGRYTCDLADFNFNSTDPNKPLNYKVGWESKMAAVRSLGYNILMQGCSSEHFNALAVPPAPDGSQGRAFCSTESGIRIGDDGNTSNCLSSGKDWHGQ